MVCFIAVTLQRYPENNLFTLNRLIPKDLNKGRCEATLCYRKPLVIHPPKGDGIAGKGLENGGMKVAVTQRHTGLENV